MMQGGKNVGTKTWKDEKVNGEKRAAEKQRKEGTGEETEEKGKRKWEREWVKNTV